MSSRRIAVGAAADELAASMTAANQNLQSNESGRAGTSRLVTTTGFPQLLNLSGQIPRPTATRSVSLLRADIGRIRDIAAGFREQDRSISQTMGSQR